MDTPAQLIKVLQREAERLMQDLSTLAPDAWRRPSACDLWEVRDVVGHLTCMAERFRGTVSRAVRGAEGRLMKGGPFPASATAEGRLIQGGPSLPQGRGAIGVTVRMTRAAAQTQGQARYAQQGEPETEPHQPEHEARQCQDAGSRQPRQLM